MTNGADEMERMALRTAAQRLAELLDEAHEAVLMWKPGGGIVFRNKRGAEELMAGRPPRRSGRAPTRSSRPLQGGESMDAIDGILARGGAVEGRA